MRTHGTLAKWNDERGFGFITPAEGGKEVFVHVSAFPQDEERPRVGEVISYEVEPGDGGKLRAVRVMRPGRAGKVRPAARARASKPAREPVGALLGLVAVIAIGVYGYSRFKAHEPPAAPQAVAPARVAAPVQSPYRCDGRTRCPEMHSCAEARYFIQHCPNTAMDGDGDGVPCEQQWCN
jgi:cold shock CspA family protein